MNPIYVLTFYRGWKGVKEEAILENAWATRLQDQAFGLVLSAGKPLHKVYSRPTVFDWYQAMSRRRKTIWSGHEPEFALVDYNFPYLVYSRAVPNYDVTINLSEMAYSGSYKSELEYYNTRTEKGTREPQFCQSPSPVFVGNSTFCSEWQMRTGDGGGRPDIGLFPLWYIRYLYSMGSTTLSEAQKTDFYKRSLL